MPRFRTKPVEKEAVQWLGSGESAIAIQQLGCPFIRDELEGGILIQTLEGVMRAEVGDWIIKGLMGEFYPCKSDVFERTYERVDGPS